MSYIDIKGETYEHLLTVLSIIAVDTHEQQDNEKETILFEEAKAYLKSYLEELAYSEYKRGVEDVFRTMQDIVTGGDRGDFIRDVKKHLPKYDNKLTLPPLKK